MASRHQGVPNLLSWCTYSDLKDRLDEIKYKVTPDTDVNSNVNEHVTFTSGRKDSKILKQDREFDEEDNKAIDDGRNIDPLVRS